MANFVKIACAAFLIGTIGANIQDELVRIGAMLLVLGIVAADKLEAQSERT